MHLLHRIMGGGHRHLPLLMDDDDLQWHPTLLQTVVIICHLPDFLSHVSRLRGLRQVTRLLRWNFLETTRFWTTTTSPLRSLSRGFPSSRRYTIFSLTISPVFLSQKTRIEGLRVQHLCIRDRTCTRVRHFRTKHCLSVALRLHLRLLQPPKVTRGRSLRHRILRLEIFRTRRQPFCFFTYFSTMCSFRSSCLHTRMLLPLWHLHRRSSRLLIFTHLHPLRTRHVTRIFEYQP